MQFLLIAVVLVLTGADHWTTYQCLHQPVSGWEVSEANPLAGWLFSAAGLGPGLMIDSVVTLAAIAVLVSTRRLSERSKLGFLIVVAVLTGYAVVNNLAAMTELGLFAASTTAGGAV